MNQLILGFGHKRFSGKDLCCNLAGEYLAQRLSMPVCKDCFAMSLKAMCMAAFGFTEQQVWGDAKFDLDPYWEMTPGRALQLAGTEAMRNVFGQDFWIRTLERRILATPDSSFVINDVRFPNEAGAIKRWGGYVIRVDRPRQTAPADGRDSEHESETALNEYCGWTDTIINDGSIDELQQKVEQLVDRLLLLLLQ